jgi:hypothetical protein
MSKWQPLGIIFVVTVFVAFVVLTVGVRETFEGDAPQRAKYLEDMVKYLYIVVKMHSAQREVYRLSNGYAMSFTSPKLTALEKQRQYFIAKVKKDPQELAFFQENLTL